MSTQARQTGNQSALYYIATPLTGTVDAAAVNTAAADAVKVKDLLSIADTGTEATAVAVNTFQTPAISTIPGANPIPDFTFSVALDDTDSIHQALRDADQEALHAFIVSDELGKERTYTYFVCRFGGQRVSREFNEVKMLTVTAFRQLDSDGDYEKIFDFTQP